ncbi:uncharacterized protein LOC120255772 [Dioscorea cayenensis subsp. rotundata]|uniref:Uncharacterized protein LOC120255772 n=1 Tax=Dioscorea cayennensis subsp. rotundata TaxID=55577 RepID=A0AB40AX08_DIOCR|nr:uncharacterized protein LOC120255772 [Dioscorea cayenensis subsp. rotundata]
MDAIPTSISTLRTTSSFIPSNPPPLLLKPNPYLYRSRSHKSTKPPPPPPSSIQTLKPPSLLVSSSFSPPPISFTSKQHHKASTGYAAALLDASRCQNSIHAVYNDVHKLMHVLHDTKSMKIALKSGDFAKQLVVLVKMLVKKGKSGLVLEVLDEFIKLYDELTFTPVMLVSSNNI